MCLSIAIHRPADVLAKGEHAGHEWMIVHNGNGYRCGYIKVGKNHPWYGLSRDDIDADVHGGLTFAEPDEPCDAGGLDDGYWVGFDCAHGHDLPDPTLPNRHGFLMPDYSNGRAEVRSQEYVEQQCHALCEQAAAAA